MVRFHGGWLVVLVASVAAAADKSAVETFLAKEVVSPRTTLTEVQDYLETRIPKMPTLTTLQEWEKVANRLRGDMLEKVVYRGEAVGWRDAKTKVEWLDTIDGGPGYKIKKLRYEALPGLWVPALLYEPEKLAGKVPVVLNVNGHDGNGKAAPYKQIRCINLAKRGLLALNLEWVGMGQLRGEGFAHTRMNQLDLCGTSGLAPFYLNMKRGLDVLLEHPHADPDRAAVTGLSGGGWQTIFLSALDTRVKLTTPVAGYSSFLTRVRHFKDLGDSEQTPCDMATVADYTHLTAMMAPRPTLLTYNAKDDCCFESGYALPPLLDAAGPVFKLYNRDKSLRSHVNEVPGTHNYEKDNRQAFYKMVGDHFFPTDPTYSADEIDSAKEVKTKDDLAVELPAGNADFHSLAMDLARKLPKTAEDPKDKATIEKRRKELREIVKAKEFTVKAEKVGSDKRDGVEATYWKLRFGDAWTLSAVELAPASPKGTTLLVADGGRRTVSAQADRLLKADQRVVAFDPFYLGEAKVAEKDWLFALLLAAVGDRPLGLQASQIDAVGRWAREQWPGSPLGMTASGPRTSLMALVAAGLDDKTLDRLDLENSYGSLKEVLEKNLTVQQSPELFCFGLLEQFDIKPLAALAAPRPVAFVGAGGRE